MSDLQQVQCPFCSEPLSPRYSIKSVWLSCFNCRFRTPFYDKATFKVDYVVKLWSVFAPVISTTLKRPFDESIMEEIMNWDQTANAIMDQVQRTREKFEQPEEPQTRPGFEREWRYIVAKVKYLTDDQCQQLVDLIGSFDHPPIQSVVVESDWPNYEDTWTAVEQVANGVYQSPQERIHDLEEQVRGLTKRLREEQDKHSYFSAADIAKVRQKGRRQGAEMLRAWLASSVSVGLSFGETNESKDVFYEWLFDCKSIPSTNRTNIIVRVRPGWSPHNES